MKSINALYFLLHVFKELQDEPLIQEMQTGVWLIGSLLPCVRKE